MRKDVFRLRHLFVMACFVAVGAAARPQDSGQPSATPGNFARRFPNPTGRNGYEEFVTAGDLVQGSAVWQAFEPAEHGATTLVEKRKVVSDPTLERALALVRTGLEKPVTSPPEGITEGQIAPELRSFRALAGLIDAQIYVLLADGRVNEAIIWLRDGLRFAYAIQSGSRMAGLWTIVMDELFVRGFARHLGQLSVRDCDRLFGVVREWIAQPDPTLAVLAAMRDNLLSLLSKARAHPEALLDTFAPGEGHPELRSSEDAVRKALADPAGAGAMFDEAASRARSYYASAVEEMQKPVWERADPWPGDDSTAAADHLLRLVSRSPARTMSLYATDVARVQLLGVHAAIRRYLWEHDRLPASLDELDLRAMAVDPFSGKLLLYRREDDRNYTLASAGPYDPAAPGTTDAGRRTPIAIP